MEFSWRMPWPLSCSKPLDIEKRASGYPRSVSQEQPVIQRRNPTSQFPFGCYTNPSILFFGWRIGLLNKLGVVLLTGPLFMLLGGITIGEIGAKSLPNEGIKQSVRYASICMLIGGLVLGVPLFSRV